MCVQMYASKGRGGPSGWPGSGMPGRSSPEPDTNQPVGSLLSGLDAAAGHTLKRNSTTSPSDMT